MYTDRLFERVVDFLRFPLIVGVVFIHAPTKLNESAVMGTVVDILLNLCVPLYFMISGYFFFYKRNFDIHVYERNIKKRIYTLLIPYLLWNLIALVLWECRYFANTGHFISDLRFVLYSFWTSITKGGVVSSSPIDYPLWFVRDLMVMSLLSPIIHYVVKHVKIAGLALMGMLWLFDVNFNIPGLSSIALFFFSAGAYFSIHGISPLNIPFRKALYLAYAVSVLGFVLTRNCTYGYVVENLNILLGIPVFLIVIAAAIVRIDIRHNGLLNNSTFFIFALHALIITNVQSCIDSVVTISPTASFFVVPSVTIIICICCYAVVCRYFPRIANILTGNRG